jgi:aminoacrylate hydrolase
MATIETQGISIYYELLGDAGNPPVLLISGLGGTGTSWSTQVKRFSEKYFVILPDQRGTGRTSKTEKGHTTRQLAEDMVSLVKQLGLSSIHIVGSSTGGAIAQYIALDYPEVVRSLVLSSSFARFDDFMEREFYIRRKIASEWDRYDAMSSNALFLFSPGFTHDYPEKVAAWIKHAASSSTTPLDKEIGLMRIDMISSHNTLQRLKDIHQPTLVLCGDRNLCTPLPLSEEIATNIPNADLVVFQDAGELIEIEKEEKFFQTVSAFIDRC